MKPEPLRAAFIGSSSLVGYGQTGSLEKARFCPGIWLFSPDGCKFRLFLYEQEFFCPARGDNLNPNKGMNWFYT